MERLKERYLAVKCQVLGDRAWYMMESFKQTEGEHLAIRRAKAFAHVLAKARIAIHEDEILARPPEDAGYPVGYWALIRDPDGHTVELSYGQEVALVVEESS